MVLVLTQLLVSPGKVVFVLRVKVKSLPLKFHVVDGLVFLKSLLVMPRLLLLRLALLLVQLLRFVLVAKTVMFLVMLRFQLVVHYKKLLLIFLALLELRTSSSLLLTLFLCKPGN